MKKSQVSMISCTSPSDSAYGLPTSWVTSRERASLLASTSRPTCAITRPRAGAGTAAHPGCAARAARHASSKVWASPSSTSATTSSVRAGFVEVRRPPGASSRWVPSTIEAMVRDMPANLAGREPLQERTAREAPIATDAPARQLAGVGERGDLGRVDLQQRRRLLEREHLERLRGTEVGAAEHELRRLLADLRIEVALDHRGHELALGHAALEGGTVEQVGLAARQADEEGRGVGHIVMISRYHKGRRPHAPTTAGGMNTEPPAATASATRASSVPIPISSSVAIPLATICGSSERTTPASRAGPRGSPGPK